MKIQPGLRPVAWLFLTLSSLSHAQSKELPVVVTHIRTPIKFSESDHTGAPRPGKSWIKFDAQASKHDLDVRIWKLGKFYNLEMSFPLDGQQQSILPVDDYGRLKPEVLKSMKDPFIRFTMPDGKKQMISFNCDKDKCRGLWPKFPFVENQAVTLKVEVNVRGLSGHSWTFQYNQMPFERGTVKLEKETVKLEKTDAFVSTNLYRKGSFTPPGRLEPQEPSTIDEWLFTVDEKLQATAYHRVGVLTLYEVHEGTFVVDVSVDGQSLESFELKAGDRIWAPPNTILALKAPKGGRLHRLEF